mmetsp:Transcript_50062/g.163581  ORF Transcript_50062/g.163581 Transcript_50062/m.163581 type:complete len:212 (-) Transcript_50062:1109-1744(-)
MRYIGYIVRTYVRGSRKLSLNTSLGRVKRHNAVLQRVNENQTRPRSLPAREQSRRGVRGTPSSEGRQCLWLPEGGQPARLCERLAIRQRLRTPPLGNGPLVLSPITPLHTPTPGDSHPRQTASRRAGAESAGGPQRRSAEIADEKLPSSSRRWSSLAGSWSAQCRAATRGPRGARAFGRGQRRRGRGAGRRLPPPASRRAARSRSRQTGTP